MNVTFILRELQAKVRMSSPENDHAQEQALLTSRQVLHAYIKSKKTIITTLRDHPQLPARLLLTIQSLYYAIEQN